MKKKSKNSMMDKDAPSFIKEDITKKDFTLFWVT